LKHVSQFLVSYELTWFRFWIHLLTKLMTFKFSLQPQVYSENMVFICLGPQKLKFVCQSTYMSSI